METITIVLVLLLAVVLSGMLSRLVPQIPRPLVQIAFGALIGFATQESVPLNPEVFFLLFLPPLLFLDGWRIPREELFKDARLVLGLALGLVVFTVLGMGLFIHWMIPAMPLAVAFALAAVISPTDPIAVSAIAQRVPIPKRMMHILEGESLLNDASGLVCLRFAAAAMLTSVFSLYDAALTFLWLAFGGIAAGTALTWSVMRLKARLASRIGEDSGSQILVSLLIPFAAYLIAEHMHASGILAAVAAGLTMSISEARAPALAATRIQRSAVWDTVQFAANGIIFVLLGEQLPSILKGAAETVEATGHHEAWWLAIYVVAINAGLAALRFAWVWVALRATLYRGGQRPGAQSWRIVAAMSLAGVRGAITLAGVLTLPLTMLDGAAFPGRDLAVFLAMGVIICSLCAASITLPWLLNGLKMPAEHGHELELTAARAAAAEAAIRAIEREQHARAEREGDAETYVDAAATVMELYRRRQAAAHSLGEDQEAARRLLAAERNLLLAAIRAEREEIQRRLAARELGSEGARHLIHDLDLAEARYG